MSQIESSVSSEYRDKAERAAEILSIADFPDNILVKVIFYGSAQRGVENPRDIDMCLVSEFPEEEAGLRLARTAIPILQRHGINVDPEQITIHLQGIGIDAWEKPDESEYPGLVRNIKQGEILFERDILNPQFV